MFHVWQTETQLVNLKRFVSLRVHGEARVVGRLHAIRFLVKLEHLVGVPAVRLTQRGKKKTNESETSHFSEVLHVNPTGKYLQNQQGSADKPKASVCPK